VSDWKSLAAGVAIVFALVVALLSTLLAAKWAWRGRDNHNHS
jgi:ABC-type lipoprotein release transport system permease subunit